MALKKTTKEFQNMNYAGLAFSDASKTLQEEFGSRNTYERVEKNNVVDGLSHNEIEFIKDQDFVSTQVQIKNVCQSQNSCVGRKS